MDNPHHHRHPDAADSAAMAEILDLDAEVLHSYLAGLTNWVRELAGDPPPGRILDLGAGTGTGTLALAERFPAAEVVALDMSAELLDRLRGKAGDLGVAGRIRIVRADLDTAWPAVGVFDLVWASNSLHHLADPGRVLTEVFAAIRPGGLLVVAEMDSFPRFLPEQLGGGLEERCHAALSEARADEMPHLGADWAPHLIKAGFTIEAERAFAADLTAPLPAATGRYAQASLRRMRSGVDGRIGAADLALLDALIDDDGPDGVLRRADLAVRASRTVWAARRAGR